MTNDPTAAPNADDEVVAAYLAGDLDEHATAEFERRLEREPALVTRLDALADALVSLGALDETPLPDGFDDRLAQRLAAERAPNVERLAEHRDRRDRGRIWLGIGTAAAVLAAGALVAGNMIGGMGGASEDSALTAGGAESSSSEAAAGAAMAERDASRPSAPVIVDRQVAVAGEDALRRRYEGLPEAEGLLGTPLDEAAVLADRFTAFVGGEDELYSADAAESAPLQATAGSGAGAGSAGGEEGESAGAAPKARRARLTDASVRRCLSVITAGASATLVPVRVESVRYDGTRAISYVFVTAAPDSQELDRIEVWVVRARDCSTLVFQQT